MSHSERTLNLSYDQLVLGSCLGSVLFAYHTSTPYIYLRLDRPQPFQQYTYDFGLGLNMERSMDYMLSHMGLAGLLPLDDKCNRARMIDGNNIRIVTSGDFIINIKFNNLYVFSDYNIDGLPDPSEQVQEHQIIYDRFLVRCAKETVLQLELSDEQYVKEFLHTQNNKSARKECVLVSHVPAGSEYPEYFVRARLETMLLESGVKKRRGTELVKHIDRQTANPMTNFYSDYGGVKFLYPDIENIIAYRSMHNRNDYLGYLKCRLPLHTSQA